MVQIGRGGDASLADASVFGDPVFIPHLLWFFGHLETWLLLAGLAGALAAAVVGAVLLWRRPEAGYGYTAGAFALIAFVVTLALLGAAGWVQANRAVDTALHDTYYVVGHFHFIFLVGAGLLLLGVTYAGLTALFGLIFRRWLAVLQIVLFAAGVWIVSLAQYAFAVQGLPRRFSDVSDVMQQIQFVSTIGYFATLTSLLLFAICIADAAVRRLRIQKESRPDS